MISLLELYKDLQQKIEKLEAKLKVIGKKIRF